MDENLAILRLLLLDNNNRQQQQQQQQQQQHLFLRERRLLRRRTKNSGKKKKPPPVSNHPRFRRGHRLLQTFQPFLSLQNRVQIPLERRRVVDHILTPSLLKSIYIPTLPPCHTKTSSKMRFHLGFMFRVLKVLSCLRILVTSSLLGTGMLLCGCATSWSVSRHEEEREEVF